MDVKQNNFTPARRLAAALNHQEADRIPFDLGSTKVTGININAYKGFLAYKGWGNADPIPAIADPVQQLALVNEEVLCAVGADTRGLMPLAGGGFTPVYRDDGRYTSFVDEWGIGWRMPDDNGHYYDLCAHPLAGDLTMRGIETYAWPDALDPARTAAFTRDIARWGNGEGYGLVLNGLTSGVFEMALRLRGFERFLTDMVLEPVLAQALLEKITDLKCAYWERALTLYGEQVLVAVEADDIGTQFTQLISPATYRAMIKPLHKRIFATIKRRAPGVKVFLHSCGAVRLLIEDFIDIGVDILNPVQVSATGMDTKALKRDFGDCLTFWGGAVDSQQTLPHGTPAQVRDEVRRRIEDLAPSGGFVFTAIHNIQSDVPPANMEAMLDALRDYGAY